VAADETRRAQLSETAAVEDERTHRALHSGQMPGRVKLTWCDHIKRQMSLLHFNLNSCGSTLVICMSAGASKAQKKALNDVLVGYSINYAFKLNPKDRE
jgi:hypothetical protein